MSPVLKQLTEAVVRLQYESMRIQNIIVGYQSSKKMCHQSELDDIVRLVNDASGTVTDIIFDIYCAENQGTGN